MSTDYDRPRAIAPANQLDVLQLIRSKISAEPIEEGLATFLNPFSYLRMRRKPELLAQFDAIYADGIALVLALRLAGIRAERRSFDMTSLAPQVLREAATHKTPVVLVGGEEGDASAAKEVFESVANGLDVSLARSGYFRDDVERKQVLADITDKPHSLVLAGMGAVLQERFLIDLRAAGWNGRAYTCGAFLSQTASRGARYYPRWADKLHLRWLYRIYDEPRLIRRYAIDYPTFSICFLKDVIHGMDSH